MQSWSLQKACLERERGCLLWPALMKDNDNLMIPIKDHTEMVLSYIFPVVLTGNADNKDGGGKLGGTAFGQSWRKKTLNPASLIRLCIDSAFIKNYLMQTFLLLNIFQITKYPCQCSVFSRRKRFIIYANIFPKRILHC